MTNIRKPVTEIILTDENGEEQMLIGGKVAGRGPVTSEHVAYRGRFVVKDLRKDKT